MRKEPTWPSYSDVTEALGTIHLVRRGDGEVQADELEQVYNVLDMVARKIAYDAQDRIT